MEAYTGFAEVYDLFMDNYPYEEWGTYVKGLLKEYGVVKDWCWSWDAAQVP